MKIILKILIYFLLFASILNLTIIYLFHNKIAVYINNDIIKASREGSGNTGSGEKPVIRIISGNITYNGKGTLDILDGVKAIDIDGTTDITDKVTARFITDALISAKKIKYTVIGSNGNVGTNEREITLSGYTGPALQLAENIVIKANDLDDLVQVLKSQNAIKAEDGFGKDITDSISFNYEVTDAKTNKYKITFTVNNIFADVKSYTIYKVIEGANEGPSLMLTRKSVILETGDNFNPLDYIQYAIDVKDGDLTDFVKITGKVDTKSKGQYVMTYSVSNAQAKTALARLVVYVN